jgi:hypothetical protein
MKKKLLFGLAVVVALALAFVIQGDVNAASLASGINLRLNSTLTGTVGLADASVPLNVAYTKTFANGVGASQADKVYSVQLSILTGATSTTDLQGSLVDALGAAFTPAKLRCVYIESAAANTTNLTLFGDAAHVPFLNTVATTMTLQPGGVFLYCNPPLAGTAVTAATGDILKIVNASGATATVNMVLIGTSS